jgi:6,7-dimethyl-8-ribityllumazine synthase
MTQISRGSLDGRDLTVAIVQSRFNESVTEQLLQGALEGLAELGVASERIVACSVPGAVEIPVAALRLAQKPGIDAVVALGAIIRGETSHYDYVCGMVADGCLRVSIETGVPVAFGVLTCDTADQAFSRAGSGASNKGREAVTVAVEMANLLRGREA